MHPLIGLLSIVLLTIQLLALKHPLTVGLVLIALIATLVLTDEIAFIKKNMQYAKWPILLVLIINPLLVHLGEHVILHIRLGSWGLMITLEALVYGLVMAMKLFCIIIIFQLSVKIMDKEDIFTYMSKHCRQLTLTLSMSSNAVDALQNEYERVKMVMTTRGMNLEHVDLKSKFKHSVYLIKVVLISVLESTFHRSEALYVRHYTKSPASEYQPLRWQKRDLYCLFLEGIISLSFIYAVWQKEYDFIFYPTFTGPLQPVTVLLVIATYGIIYMGIKEQKKYEQLSFNQHKL
ncbi:MAG: hypothetical protein JXO44_07605 [Clostridia bacterium]|nr:hypothetical protein [Clostridia bacterium]